MNELMRAEEVCQALRISRVTLHRLRTSGQFPAGIRVANRRVLYRREDVESWLKHRTEKRGYNASGEAA